MISRRHLVVSLVLIASALPVSAIAPVHACELTCRGANLHRTGDEGGGCFGLDPDDPASACEAAPGASYRLHAGPGCTGAEVASGEGHSSFDPPARAASVELACPPGT